jgi:hypothetical protein
MASILYNDHLIVSHPVLDEATETWTPKIQVTLTLGKTQSFKTKSEAEQAGFDAAKRLIDSFAIAVAPPSLDGHPQSD